MKFGAAIPHFNERALELTRANAQTAQAANISVAAPGDVPDDIRFDAIYSNPPVRVGKGPLHALLLEWLPRWRPAAPPTWSSSATSARTRSPSGWRSRASKCRD